MKMATTFLMEAICEDEEAAGHWEWPKRCSAWVQPPMLEIANYFDKNYIPWLGCRVDGFCYGLRDSRDQNFIKKEWVIKTTSELFHRRFRAKVCPGNHTHTLIEGSETARTSYYAWRFVQAVCRHWRDVMVPPRHLRLVAALQPLHDSEVDYLPDELQCPELPSRSELPPGELQCPELPSRSELPPGDHRLLQVKRDTASSMRLRSVL